MRSCLLSTVKEHDLGTGDKDKADTIALTHLQASKSIHGSGGHYIKMAYDEFYSIFWALSQMCLILFYFFSLWTLY